MPSLTLLSNDLLLYTSHYIDRKDCKNLRLTCCTFADLFAVCVLSSFTINVGGPVKESNRPTLDILRWMTSGNSNHKRRVEAIRTLSVKSLSPANSIHGDKVDEARIVLSNNEIMSVLQPALLSLSNIRTLRWEPQKQDPSSSHEVVASCIASCPQLQHLEINMTHLTSPVLTHFKNLTSIEYIAWRQNWHTLMLNGVDPMPIPAVVVDAFAQAMIQSPRLACFKFSPADERDEHLKRVFEQCNDVGVTLPLNQLILYSCIPPLTLLPHLQQLSHLEILSTSTLYQGIEGQQQLYEDLWRSLSMNDIRLRHISVDRVTEALVDYLKRYQGLEEFRVYNDSLEEHNATMTACVTAGRFYDEALVNHYLTLESLEINPQHQGQWCFRPAYQATISQCKNLKRLALGLEDGQIGDLVDPENPSLYVLLDTIAKHCLFLRDLTVYIPMPHLTATPDPTGHRHFRTVQAIWYSTGDQLLSWVAPHGSNINSLPKVHFTGLMRRFYYVAVEESSGGLIKYSERRGV